MSSTPNTFVAQISLALADKLKKDLIEQDFEITTPEYTVFSAKKKGISCTLYTSGKLVVQGKEKNPFIEFYLEPNILQSFDYTYSELNINKTARIGIDESGKGDFFGPLCVAGVYAEGEAIAGLAKLGVKDSKSLSDSTIRKIARSIREQYQHHLIRINPAKYNELYQKFGNLNHLLAWGHATTIEHLTEKTKCRYVIIDQFAAEHVVENALKRKQLSITLTQRHRAEEDLVVAAASILARDLFLSGLEQLSENYGIALPKGASDKTIAAGKAFVAKHGIENLPQVAKMHFKTLDAITQ